MLFKTKKHSTVKNLSVRSNKALLNSTKVFDISTDINLIIEKKRIAAGL
jgi:hypothetical protein